MSISPFAFDPPTGWNDATVFPTHESSEVRVRADMQELHDQTRDYINTMVTALNNNLLQVSLASFSSLPQTVYNAAITSEHTLIRAEVGTPSAQVGEWTVTTANGSATISGTISGSTTLTLILGVAGSGS